MVPRAPKGRLIVPSEPISEGSKKRRFFDVASGSQKIDKNRALEPQGPKKVQRPLVAHKPRGIDGPRAVANYQRNTRKKGSRIEKEILTRRGPLARRI